MWLSRTDYEQLVRQAAQSELLSAALSLSQHRAEDAEKRLAVERAAKDNLILQLASRVVTKNGGYGLESPTPPPEQPLSTTKPFVREPDEVDLAKLEYYKKCFIEAEYEDAEERAEKFWAAEMRGENPMIETEVDE